MTLCETLTNYNGEVGNFTQEKAEREELGELWHPVHIGCPGSQFPGQLCNPGQPAALPKPQISAGIFFFFFKDSK